MNQRKKTYVLDTSVVIEDPDIFFKLGDGDIVVSTAVIKEIDGLKRNTDEMKAAAARKVSRTLDRIGSYGHISTGARIFTGSTVLITAEHAEIDDLASNADNRIVGTAIRLKKESGNEIILVSADGNMRNVTRAYGIRAEDYPVSLNGPYNRPRPRVCHQKMPSPIHVLKVAQERHWQEQAYKSAMRHRGIDLPKRIALAAVLSVIIFILFVTVGQ